MAHLISWKKGDYIKLGKAIKDFNRKVDKLESMGIDYAPSKLDYTESKENIYSRQELNRVIKSLRRFGEVGTTDLYNKLDEPLTKWEASEIAKARNRARRNLERERVEIETSLKIENTISGNKRLDEIEATLESISLENIKSKKGYEFKRIKERTLFYGKTDLTLKKASDYRKSFMKALDELSSYDNYDKLINKLNKIKNPEEFYKFIRQSDVLSDLFIFYKDKATAQTYGGFASNQDAFNYALEELNIM